MTDATVVAFIECINRGDIDALATLMTHDHRLVVFDEEPVVGRDANVTAWRGYTAAFPDYVIHASQIASDGIVGGALSRWQIVADSPATRAELRLGAPAPS